MYRDWYYCPGLYRDWYYCPGLYRDWYYCPGLYRDWYYFTLYIHAYLTTRQELRLYKRRKFSEYLIGKGTK